MIKMKFKIIIKWFDFYIGFYYDKELKTLYFFPIHCIGLMIYGKLRTYKI